MAQDDERYDADRQAAEQAFPGWTVVARPQQRSMSDAPARGQADAVGADMAQLKARFLGADRAEAAPGPSPNGDATFVTLKPAAEAVDSPPLTRKAVLSGGRVVGVQG